MVGRPKKLKDITKRELALVENLAAFASKEYIADTLGVARKTLASYPDVDEAIKKGNRKFKDELISTYKQMALSGMCWSATKHALACAMDIVEPKEPITIESKDDVPFQVIFTSKGRLAKKDSDDVKNGGGEEN